MKIEKLEQLPNIGKTLSEKLKLVEIDTPEKLYTVGSEQVFLKIYTIDDNACYNMLCALEGAIQGIRWHNLDAAKKDELKEFYKMISRSSH